MFALPDNIPANPQGVMAVFEGNEGTGKSTVAKAVAAHYAAQGVAHVHQREPGGIKDSGSMAEELRAVLLKKDRPEAVSPVTDILIHMAYRRQNVMNTITPALLRGEVVLSERFMLSTYALNVVPHGNGMASDPLANLFMGLIPPVLEGVVFEPVVFMLHLPEDVRKQRLEGRVLDRYEDQSPEYLESVRKTYEQYTNAPNTIVLDALRPVEELVAIVVESIDAQRVKQIEQARQMNEQKAEAEAELAQAEGNATSDNPPTDADPVTAAPEPIVELTTEQKLDALLDTIAVKEITGNEADIPTIREFALRMAQRTMELIGEHAFFFPPAQQDFVGKIQSMFYYKNLLDQAELNLAKPIDQVRREAEEAGRPFPNLDGEELSAPEGELLPELAETQTTQTAE
jgi:dTMP kinase